MFGTKRLKRFVFGCTFAVAAFLGVPAALASDPTGVWLTKDKAEITISRCGGNYCGVVSKPAKPGLRDIRNPDPALNGRPIMGMPLLEVGKSDNRGKHPGELYNPLDGKFYEGTLELRTQDKLRVRGCVLRIFCLHEDWVRIGS